MLVIGFAIGAAAAQTEAEKLIEAGHWKKARAFVEARMRENPRDALSHFLLSQIRNAFGDTESPAPLAERAVALDGGVAKYHRQMAEVLGVKAQHSGILQQLVLARRFKREIDTAIELDPRDLQALRDVMEFYLLAPAIGGGDKSKAWTTADQIARIDSAEGYSAKARLAAFHGDRSRVEGLLRKAVESGPTSYNARIALANFFVPAADRNLEGAEHQAKEAIKIDRGRAEAYAVLAGIYAAGSRWADLDSILTAAEKEVPDDLVPHYRAGTTLLESNRALDRAVVYLRKYAAAEPEGNRPRLAEARWKLGRALEILGRTAEAQAEWSESIRLDRNSAAWQDLKRTRRR